MINWLSRSVLFFTCYKIMVKILQARIQQYVSQKLLDVNRLEKAEEPDQIANIHWIIENAREILKKGKENHLLLLH